ncbi:hypothetical protein [Psychrobacter sp. PAMC 21119]|uniref:hypothetical protein n=1 Tax=Psychrobacter sp. PAMC 21119 TaxID=1112209 RepID=UPI000289F0DD|nr:hypothetical protein [Psychrobacter sp. PAMC 21119]
MKQILKHSFEAVSLLTTNNGMLDVTIVPAFNQPDWIIPSSLILSVDDFDEHIWTYLWQQQEVAVFHLLSSGQTPEKIIVLEGNTAAHRIALQTVGELHHLQVRISDVKDIELPEQYTSNANISYSVAQKTQNSDSETVQATGENLTNSEIDYVKERFQENVVESYLFQTVIIDNMLYLVPDLDKIAHQLVDLDS